MSATSSPDPALAEALPAPGRRCADDPPGLRAFGQQAIDLEPDFDAEDRPALVTALLAGCSVGADSAAAQAHWWQAPVGTRIAALLDLMLLSMPAGPAPAALDITLRCQHPDCGRRFDITLPAQAWARPSPAAQVTLAREGADPLLLRQPNGSDLRACREQALRHADPARMARDLLDRLCLAGTPQPDDPARVAEALAQADPLVDFAVHCACPECGSTADRPIDLEAHALQALASRQRALLQQVHQLASHYGWTEREVFEVPAARRSRYLQAIAAASQAAAR